MENNLDFIKGSTLSPGALKVEKGSVIHVETVAIRCEVVSNSGFLVPVSGSGFIEMFLQPNKKLPPGLTNVNPIYYSQTNFRCRSSVANL